MKSLYGLIFIGTSALALDHEVSGVIDIRTINSNSITSYVDGGLGKFRFDPDTHIAIAQMGLAYDIEWNDTISSKVVANGYWDSVKNGIGITEAFCSI